MKKRFSPLLVFSTVVLFLILTGCSLLKARQEKPETQVSSSPAEFVKKANVAGQFYPENEGELRSLINSFPVKP
jgi:hypothetical protein